MLRRLKPFLRQYAENALALAKSIRDHHQALHDAEAAGDREAQLVANGTMSDAFRMLGQLDPAVRHGEAAVALARELDHPKFLVSNLIRLATALQYRNEHAAAEPLFQEGRALAAKVGVLEDYALQHHGKSLAEQGRWAEAIACFERALAIREAKHTADLAASTREALEEARARAGGQAGAQT